MVITERYYENKELKFALFNEKNELIMNNISYIKNNDKDGVYDAKKTFKFDDHMLNVYFSFNEKYELVGAVYNDYFEDFAILRTGEYNFKETLEFYFAQIKVRYESIREEKLQERQAISRKLIRKGDFNG